MATVFVGGSALLLAGAMAALAFGFANGEDSLVWTALIASAAAAVFLVIAYFVSRRDLRRASAARESTPDTTITTPATAAEGRPAGITSVRGDEWEQTEDGTAWQLLAPDERAPEVPEEAASGPTLAPGSPTAKPSTTKRSSAPGTAGAAKPSSPSDAVVAIASKKKFHRPDCRYAKSESGEEMSRASARKRGYSPCGICKP
jgi:hypothetical protein